MSTVVAPLLQLKNVPPLAVKTIGCPAQVEGFDGNITAEGLAFTSTLPVSVAVQPLASVTVTM
jgi:hypothetical protein